jgi:hypothetical protein
MKIKELGDLGYESNIELYIETTKEQISYCEAIITPYGDTYDARPSHIQYLSSYTGLDNMTLYNQMPANASPVPYLVDYTGCIAVWYTMADIPYTITDAQLHSLKRLQDSGRISNHFKLYVTNEKEVCEVHDNVSLLGEDFQTALNRAVKKRRSYLMQNGNILHHMLDKGVF